MGELGASHGLGVWLQAGVDGAPGDVVGRMPVVRQGRPSPVGHGSTDSFARTNLEPE